MGKHRPTSACFLPHQLRENHPHLPGDHRRRHTAPIISSPQLVPGSQGRGQAAKVEARQPRSRPGSQGRGQAAKVEARQPRSRPGSQGRGQAAKVEARQPRSRPGSQGRGQAAKVEARQQVYADRNHTTEGTLYCGCTWQWTGKSGGRVDLASCGYTPRKNANRAARIEWEHIVPAWTFGHQRQCWQNGGRKNCVANDPVFGVMESDLHNLAPSVGEVNGDRSNFNYGMVQKNQPLQYGQCPTRTDFKARTTEPRDEAKGLVARVTFYMADRYGLTLSKGQQQILMAWDHQHPVSAWEIERDRRITKVMGHQNPYVTGEKKWKLGQKPSRDGLRGIPASAPILAKATTGINPAESAAVQIIGNRNSHVYHLPHGCPSYGRVAKHNRVLFSTEADALAAGYRKAGNCRQ
ncbi:MAG: endonuclease [Castellaniella sp.]|uniref:endonuclease n=1 Tax=Castellaniella sp. TaxID=1955812 RepID=UPI003A87FD8D